MPSLSSWLLAASAFLLLAMGSYHLLLTFRGSSFNPRDEAVRTAMEAVSPKLTSQTSMWNAWIGFNASHSFGAMLFGLVYGYLALAEPATLFRSVFLQFIGLALLASYCLVAARYWFKSPLRGVLLSASLYAAALIIHWI
jgi:hypothetical protein